MWRQVLVFSTMLWVGCVGSSVTCDPTVTNPNCPDGRICDPTGICQKTCVSNTDCTDPGTICDLSVQSPAPFPLCQKDCSSALCPNGQLCYPHVIPSTNAQDADQTLQTCKQKCQFGDGICGVENKNFNCQSVLGSNSNICYGPFSS